MGDMIVCYKVCLGMVFDKSPFFLVDEIPREGIYDNRGPFRGSVFREIRGVQTKHLIAFAVSSRVYSLK